VVAYKTNNPQAFKKCELSQEPAAGPYPVREESTLISYLFVRPIDFNIIHYYVSFVLRSGSSLHVFELEFYTEISTCRFPMHWPCHNYNNGKVYKLCRSSLYNCLQFPVTSSPLGRNVLLSSLLSNTIHAHLRIFWYEMLNLSRFTFLGILYKFLLGLNIRLSAVFPNAFNLCSSSKMFLY
jgi:hypothetical protein